MLYLSLLLTDPNHCTDSTVTSPPDSKSTSLWGKKKKGQDMQHIKEKSTSYTENKIRNTSVIDIKLITHSVECPPIKHVLPWILNQCTKWVENIEHEGSGYIQFVRLRLSIVVATKSKYRLQLNVEYWMRVACGTHGEGERCIQGYDGETWQKETTWKTQA